MSRKHIAVVAVVALTATLLSVSPAAAAARPAAPRAAQVSPFRQALAWLSALWGGGREHAATARSQSGSLSPSAGPTPDALLFRPAPRPAGSGIDPDGFF